jgi:DNA polymerase III epsilon subunit-like protein
MKYVSIDLEMCGKNSDTCSILEFGAIVDDLKDQRNVNSLPYFHCYFVHDTYVGEPFALSMHTEIFKRISSMDKQYNFMNPRKFGYSFKKFLIGQGYEEEHDKVKINVAGKNFFRMDYSFLEKQTDLFKHVAIRSRILDPAMLFVERKDETLPSLPECKERAGIKGEVSHNALDDARDVVKLIRKGWEYKFQ